MNGQQERLAHSHESLARLVAYLSPYLFWTTVGVICVGIWLMR